MKAVQNYYLGNQETIKKAQETVENQAK